MRRIVLGSVALSFVLVFAACGTDDPEVDGSSTSTTTSTAPRDSSTTESTGTDGTTSTTEPPIPASNAEAYVDALIDAWVSGNRDAAEVLAVPAAVDTLFSYEPAEDGADPTWAIQICEGAAGSSYCTVSAGGDPKIIVRVTNEAASQGAARAVTEVKVES